MLRAILLVVVVVLVLDSAWGGNRSRAGEARRPGSDGASRYPLERRSMLRTILLVVVVVLVLDSPWGATVAARVRRAARFGRSLSLPP
jgi:ABC-type Fe3+ transport system permease subunit